MFRKRTRFRDLRLNTSNCPRRTMISASRAARTSNAERRASRIRLRHVDKVLTRDKMVLRRYHPRLLRLRSV